jgi:AcrR family transcriptional regulator
MFLTVASHEPSCQERMFVLDCGMPKVSQAHKDARRRQILTAATRCVATQGFHRTTMADVIREADLSAGAVYGYFASKTELIRAIADSALGSAAQTLEELAAGDGPVTPTVVLEAYLDSALQAHGDTSPQVAVQVWAEAARDPQVASMAADRILALRTAMTTLVRRCQADGTLPPDGDPVLMAQALVGLLPGFVLQRLLDRTVTTTSYLRGAADLLGPAPLQ